MQATLAVEVGLEIEWARPANRGSARARMVRAGHSGMSNSQDGADAVDIAEKLAAVARTQDMDAFEALFRYFSPKIRAYMMKRSADRQLAEELMQETMITVWKKAALFDPARGSASSWIFTIARNVRIDAFRRTNRPEFDPNDPAFVPDEFQPADRLMEKEQSADLVRKAMKTLPPEQLELLKLAFFEEASHSRISEMLGLPLGTVKSRIRLAFARLRDALGDRA